MAGENSQIKQVHGFTDPLTAPQMRAQNPDHYDNRMPRMYPIHRHIYIYSVARRTFPRKHVYWNASVSDQGFNRPGLAGCLKGERFVLCGSIPDPPQQIAVDAERGGWRVEVEPRDEAGWRVAIDILNPNNPSTDPYATLGPNAAAYYSTGENVNLMKFGLFPSLNNPPTEAELLRAEAERDKSYSELVDEAFQEQASNPQGFRLWLKTHSDINVAMDSLGIEADWFQKVEVKISCPNCGDKVKAGIAFHKSSAGVLCVIDAERAAKAGVRVQDDEDEPRRGPGRPRKDAA